MFLRRSRALRSGGPALGQMEPQRLIAAGESQSAFAMVTYYNGVQPLTQAFDGFLVHSRGAGSLPLVEPGEYAFLTDALGAGAVRIRPDVAAPVMNIQAENDTTGILNSIIVRQPDSDTFRLWEVAGTALGGIRTPMVDVPVDVLSGVAGPNPDAICILSGSTAPLSEARLAQLYASRDDYVQRYAASTDAAIAAGFILAADREALIAKSDPARLPPDQ